LKKKGGLDKVIKSGKIDKFIKEGAYSLIRAQYLKDNFVFDLSGGSVSSRKHPEVSKEVRRTANENSIVIGLLPSEDDSKSIQILFNREKNRSHFKDMSKEELFKKVEEDYYKFPELFKTFCNIIIYTENKTPEKISDEIIKLLEKNRNPYK